MMTARWQRRCLAMTLALGALVLAPSVGQADQGLTAEQKKLVAIRDECKTLKKAGRFQEAQLKLEDLERQAPNQFEASSIWIANFSFELAELYRIMAQPEAALPRYGRARAIWHNKGMEPWEAVCLGNMGLFFQEQGEYVKAQPYYEASLKILEKDKKNPKELANTLTNLGSLRQLLGDYTGAEEYCLRSLAILQRNFGPEDICLADTLTILGRVYLWMGNYPKAEAQLLRSLRIQDTASQGKAGWAIAATTHDLGCLYLWQGKFEKAKTRFLESLKIYQEKFPSGHPQVATNQKNLAQAYQGLNRLDEAEKYYNQSLKIFDAQFHNLHPGAAMIRMHLAELSVASGDLPRAAVQVDEARHLLRQYALGQLQVLAEPDQLDFLNIQETRYRQQAFSLALALREKDPALVAKSAEWVLNGKGMAHQVLAQRELFLRDHRDGEVGKLTRDLYAVRKQLANMEFQKLNEAGEKRKQELKRRERQLDEAVARKGGAQQRSKDWVTLDSVRQTLPKDAVLVEIARFHVWDFQAKGHASPWQEPHYAAWIIPAAGKDEVQLLDLGPAKEIDRQALAISKAFKDAPKRIIADDGGVQKAEKEVHVLLVNLAAKVLTPLEKVIPVKNDRWILSPDAYLWLVPWAALPLPNQKDVALEKYKISYVLSGRDLIQEKVNVRGQAPLVMANPDYDMRPVNPKPKSEVAGGARFDRAERLTLTEAEAKAISKDLEIYAGLKPVPYYRENAREQVFKDARNPKVVVVGTHGFSFAKAADGPEALPGEWDGQPSARRGQALQNPFYDCGLLFAGCNQRGNGTDANGNDGVLTAKEILSVDLRGTELVVLSACETGLGKVRSGEGVAGLRQALQLAGAQAVVSSLWSVENEPTTELMKKYFKGLAKGLGKADALRQAQLDYIKELKERDSDVAHPFYWAAFTLTGQWK